MLLMKTLYLVRHGKGVPRKDDCPDQQRQLSKTGAREVMAMSLHLRQSQILPDVILCSPTERACQTAEIMTHALECAPDRIEVYDETLLNDHEGLFKLIRNQPDAAQVVMVIGHQPALSGVAQKVVPLIDTTIRTSSVIGIDFTCERWAEIAKESARLLFYEFPQRLMPKVSQAVRQTVVAHLRQFVRVYLEYGENTLPKDLENAIKKSGRQLAKTLVRELQIPHVTVAVPVNPPESGTEPTPSIPAQEAATQEPPRVAPTPATKRKRGVQDKPIAPAPQE